MCAFGRTKYATIPAAILRIFDILFPVIDGEDRSRLDRIGEIPPIIQFPLAIAIWMRHFATCPNRD